MNDVAVAFRERLMNTGSCCFLPSCCYTDSSS
jgi:hypothetical protein